MVKTAKEKEDENIKEQRKKHAIENMKPKVL